MSVVTVAVICGLVSGLITARVRAYALHHNVLDQPNERSSHVTPVPRGGGLAITLVTLAAVAVLYLFGRIDSDIAVAIVGGGGAVAWIGWRDDHESIPAIVRALVHFAAAGWAVFWLDALPSVRLGEQVLHLGWAGGVLATIGIVWLLNLYNFMDGIDGIAGVQGVSVAGMGAIISVLLGAPQIGLVSASLAGACAGFLVWNWAPARIFMGDVGSGFVGYTFAVVALASEREGGASLLVWGLMLLTFIFDATVTLLRRIAHGERWSAAHRRHAYQRGVLSGLTHRQVTLAYLTLNCILFGIAWQVAENPADFAAGGFVALLLLTAGYLWVERREPMYALTDRLPLADTESELGSGKT